LGSRGLRSVCVTETILTCIRGAYKGSPARCLTWDISLTLNKNMGWSSESLVAALNTDSWDLLSAAAQADYGFAFAKNDAHRRALFTVYRTILQHGGVTHKDFHRHLMDDSLNQWVAMFFKKQSSDGKEEYVFSFGGKEIKCPGFATFLAYGGVRNPYVGNELGN